MISNTSPQIAFKEWAAICAALAAGRQTIILRKGGIHEGRAGFRVQHREFWLYPTNFHQAAEGLTAEAGEFIARVQAEPRTPGTVPVQHLAVIHAVHQLQTEDVALHLAGLHLWSEATVRQRFHYRQPGLFLLVARIFKATQAFPVVESAEMAGCKSWVELPQAFSTSGIVPALDDKQFSAAVAAVGRRLDGAI